VSSRLARSQRPDDLFVSSRAIFNDKHELLVLSKVSDPDIWFIEQMAEEQKRVPKLSDEIRSAVQRQGYYMRRQRDTKVRTKQVQTPRHPQ
jgi:uncharacterized protein YcgL (UPF0745 family)